MDAPPDRIVLHTSWRGRALFVGAPAVLMGLGALALSGDGRTVPVVLLGLGTIFLLVGLADFPLSCAFGVAGIERRCALRTGRLSWEQVSALARPPRSVRSRSMKLANTAGLAAEVGRRRFLLTDRIESAFEFDELELAIARWAPGLPMRASRPHDGAAPTWMYKRRPGDGLVDTR